MRAIGALVIIILGGLAPLFAGVPALEPDLFQARVAGVPFGVIFMCLLMIVFVGVSSWCSAAARESDRRNGGV